MSLLVYFSLYTTRIKSTADIGLIDTLIDSPDTSILPMANHVNLTTEFRKFWNLAAIDRLLAIQWRCDWRWNVATRISTRTHRSANKTLPPITIVVSRNRGRGGGVRLNPILSYTAVYTDVGGYRLHRNIWSEWIRKTNQMSLFVFFISLLIVAQHVSGQPRAHHQELTTAWCYYSLVLVCAVAAGRLSSPVGR